MPIAIGSIRCFYPFVPSSPASFPESARARERETRPDRVAAAINSCFPCLTKLQSLRVLNLFPPYFLLIFFYLSSPVRYSINTQPSKSSSLFPSHLARELDLSYLLPLHSLHPRVFGTNNISNLEVTSSVSPLWFFERTPGQ